MYICPLGERLTAGGNRWEQVGTVKNCTFAGASGMVRFVAVNEIGLRIGEDHPRAKLTDAEVELVRQLYADGMRYGELAEKFECSKWAIGRICRYERRAQTVAAFKVLKAEG